MNKSSKLNFLIRDKILFVGALMSVAHSGGSCSRRVLKDLRWCIRHHSSVEKNAELNKSKLSAGPRFDSGRNPVNSNQCGFEPIHPQARFLDYCFQYYKPLKSNRGRFIAIFSHLCGPTISVWFNAVLQGAIISTPLPIHIYIYVYVNVWWHRRKLENGRCGTCSRSRRCPLWVNCCSITIASCSHHPNGFSAPLKCSQPDPWSMHRWVALSSILLLLLAAVPSLRDLAQWVWYNRS